MKQRLTCAAIGAYVFVVVGLGMHVAGFVTSYWMSGQTEDQTGQSIVNINVGLWEMRQEFNNGTVLETDSPIAKKEEQYIVLAIAAINTIFCLIVLLKAVHLCVGLVSFISVAMMLIAAFFVYKNIEARLNTIKEERTELKNLTLSYSFYLTFAGILLNIVATVIFLTLLLIREERKASKSTKGLGVCDIRVSEQSHLKANDILEDSHKYETVDAASVTHGKNSVYENTATINVISGNSFIYENAGYNSMQEPAYAGPSGEVDFNHITVQSSRL